MGKIIKTAGCAALLGASLIGCGPLPTTHHSADWTAPGATSVAAPPVASTSQFAMGQEQAIEKAKSYLDYTAFSKIGLIRQLTTAEHFSQADATFAVENIESTGAVDWNEQAVRKAKSYLDYSSFSRDGLVTQLESAEDFTPAQAQHGADVAYGG